MLLFTSKTNKSCVHWFEILKKCSVFLLKERKVLSLNNLMTKKGRTFLTSFAGSIGIIGIALIMSLSNGMQN